MSEVIKGAKISECQKYRYSLWRIWDETKPKIMFVMLNPSTADATKDDATIRRCTDFTKNWGYGGFYVCNLFAYRSTNPKELLTQDNPFGDENIYQTRQLTDKVSKIICAWGNRPILSKILKRQNELDLLPPITADKLYYLELSKDKTPKHPLYLRKNLIPQRF